MQCPFCGKDEDKVVDSRSSEGGLRDPPTQAVSGLQQCFTTYERAEGTIRLTVLKKDGSRQPYHREKIIVGLQKASYRGPVTDEQIRRIVDAAEESLARDYDREVPSSAIGDTLSNLLKDLDKIAYVRFASVYRNFADVGELIEEAQEVKDAPATDQRQKDLFADGQG